VADAAVGKVTRRFVLPLEGAITSQILAAGGNFFVATSAGQVVSFTPDGVVRWKVELGQLAHACPQLDGYGVTGTGVIDTKTSTLYVADAFGYLHALALSTGTERAGWPVRVFPDNEKQLVWGALTLAKGAVFVPTASYCDLPMLGGLYRIGLATKRVTAWISVPESLGGGGGVWGWGGAAYSAKDNALYVVTANALAGGENVGTEFTESAGFGEHIVRLSPALDVQASSHPPNLVDPLDLDFAGSPVVFTRPGCGDLAVAADKADDLYAWKRGSLASGPIWELKLEPFDERNPFLSQLAWSPAHSAVYAVTGTELVRISIAADCSPKVAWRVPLATPTEHGSPTISGNTVWFAVSGSPLLVGYDARTGKRTFKTRMGGITLVAPTIVYGRLVVGTMTGLVEGFAYGKKKPAKTRKKQSERASADVSSWIGSRYGWKSVTSGVYATDDGGRMWRRIYSKPALVVVRVSRTAGLIDLALDPSPCMCTTRKLWTADGGRTWHPTTALGDHFAGSSGTLYWWVRGSLFRIMAFPPRPLYAALRSKLAISVPDGRIVDAKAIPGGVAALVSRRVGGKGWDAEPRVVIARGDEANAIALPAHEGRILAHELEADWPNLTVTGTDYAAEPARAVTWSSTDGGATWQSQP
jgi:hypothetical protein